MLKKIALALVVVSLWTGSTWAMMAEDPIVIQAINLAREAVWTPFSANARGDPLRSDPPRSFVCSSFVTWAYWEASGRAWDEWYPTDTILDVNGLNGRRALVRFFTYRSESELRPGDIVYRSPHSRIGHLPSRPRDHWDKRGEPGFNQADPRHDYHHMALYLGHGEVAQAGGDRRGDVVLAGPRSYGIRITKFDTKQWAPEAGRPLRLIHPQLE